MDKNPFYYETTINGNYIHSRKYFLIKLFVKFIEFQNCIIGIYLQVINRHLIIQRFNSLANQVPVFVCYQ